MINTTAEGMKHIVLTVALNGEGGNITPVLKEWAESIIEETISYDWTETTWEEQKEQLREIKWKL